MTGRSSYKALVTIFSQQCELSDGKVVVKAKTGGDCMQNPSDLDATYDAHKGPGYQVQIAETCSPANEVQLITGALPQSAAEPDGAAVVPMLDQLEESKLLPEEMLADTLYGGDENVQAAADRGVELVGRSPAGEPTIDPQALTLDDFAVDERTGRGGRLPARAHAAGGRAGRGGGHDADRDAGGGLRGMPVPRRLPDPPDAGWPLRAGFHRQGASPGWAASGTRDPGVQGAVRAMRSGIESTNSGLKNRLGLERLRVRGRGSVFRVILHKVAGWNVLRAAASKKLRAWVSDQVAQTLKGGESGPTGRLCAPVLRLWDGFQTVFRASHGCSHGLGGSCGRLSKNHRLLTRGFCR